MKMPESYEEFLTLSTDERKEILRYVLRNPKGGNDEQEQSTANEDCVCESGRRDV